MVFADLKKFKKH